MSAPYPRSERNRLGDGRSIDCFEPENRQSTDLLGEDLPLRFQRLQIYVLVASMAMPLPGQFGPPKAPKYALATSWGLTVFPFSLVLIPLLIAWACDYVSRPSPVPGARRRGADPVLIATLLFVGFALASCIANKADYRMFCLYGWLFALFAFARYRMPQILGRDRLAVALSWMMVGLALISAAQFKTGTSVGALAQYFQHGVRQAQVYSGSGGGGLLKRVQGTFFSTDEFAQFLLYVLLFLIALTRVVKNNFVVLCMLGTGILIGLTFSRGVWGSTAVLVPLMMIVFIRRGQLKRSRLIALSITGVAVIVVAFVLAASTIFARLSATQVSSSAQTRDTATQVGIAVIGKAPLFGVGYFKFIYESNILNVNPQNNLIRPHNMYVQIWAEQGILALLAYIGIGGAMLWEASRRRRLDDPAARALRVGVIFMVVAWMVFGLVYATADDYSVMPVWFLLCGYGLTLLDTQDRVVDAALADVPVMRSFESHDALEPGDLVGV
jgi:O-antigen ligase